MRAEKTVMFNKLKTARASKEYEEWFLKYRPGGIDNAEVVLPTEPPAKKKKSKASSKTKRKHKVNASQKTRSNKKRTRGSKKTRSNTKRTRGSKKTRKDRVNHYLKTLMGRKKK
jgi:hypothetical protein